MHLPQTEILILVKGYYIFKHYFFFHMTVYESLNINLKKSLRIQKSLIHKILNFFDFFDTNFKIDS